MLPFSPAPRLHRPHFPLRKNFPATTRQSERLPCETRQALFPDGPPLQSPAYLPKRRPLPMSQYWSPPSLSAPETREVAAEVGAESPNFLLHNRPAGTPVRLQWPAPRRLPR